MSGDATISARILRALGKGPLYEGVIPLIVNADDAQARRILLHLQTLGHVKRNSEGTWRLA